MRTRIAADTASDLTVVHFAIDYAKVEWHHCHDECSVTADTM